MCNIGAVGLGIQGAGMVANYSADEKAKSAYESYQAATTAAALANYSQQSNALNNRYSEEQEATAVQQQQIMLANMRAKATAQASAAGSGVEGSTIDELFNGYDRATAVNDFTSARNLSMKKLQYNDELEGLRVNALSTINLEQYYPATGVSKLLSGAGGIFDNYDNYTLKQQQRSFYKGSKL